MYSAIMSEAEFKNLLAHAPGPDEKLPSDLDFSFVRAYIESRNSPMKDLFQVRCCTPGEVIMFEGEEGNEIFIIRFGRVAIFKGEFNAPVILGFRGAGDMIGEMAVLEKMPRSATVVALEETDLLVTDRAGFFSMLNQSPFLGSHILEMLSQRLRKTTETHRAEAIVTRALSSQVEELESEKRHLMELERLRQETTDLIVHDLRNPLSSIVGSIKVLQMLLSKDVSPETRELVDIVWVAAGRMQRLVDSMLEVSRMQAGESELNLGVMDLRALVRRTVDNVLRPHGNDIHYTVTIPPDLPSVEADGDRLERVLANLLDNAIKHSPSQGSICVDVCQVQDGLEVRVTDGGPGIPVEERQRIFERFAQVTGEKVKWRGFGLGLSFCKLTVEAHGGTIWVESGHEGIGSCFAFQLPFRR